MNISMKNINKKNYKESIKFHRNLRKFERIIIININFFIIIKLLMIKKL